jgi:hypothetical protein
MAIQQERAGCCFYTTLKILLCVFAFYFSYANFYIETC